MLTAMNWLEPANTATDSAKVAHTGMPLPTAKVPKITPKGAAPTIMGMVSRAPAQKGRKIAPD
jgi:hypothetical protein